MANKWKVSDADTFWEVYKDEKSKSYSLLSESEAHALAGQLNKLEHMEDEIHDAHVTLDDCGIHRERLDGELLTLCERIEIQDNSYKDLMEEFRWRKIGEEWPEDGQDCILGNSKFSSEIVTFGSEKTGWASSGHCGNCDSGGTDRQYGPDGKERYAEYDYPAYTHWRPVPTDLPKEEDADV